MEKKLSEMNKVLMNDTISRLFLSNYLRSMDREVCESVTYFFVTKTSILSLLRV